MNMGQDSPIGNGILSPTTIGLPSYSLIQDSLPSPSPISRNNKSNDRDTAIRQEKGQHESENERHQPMDDNVKILLRNTSDPSLERKVIAMNQDGDGDEDDEDVVVDIVTRSNNMVNNPSDVSSGDNHSSRQLSLLPLLPSSSFQPPVINPSLLSTVASSSQLPLNIVEAMKNKNNEELVKVLMVEYARQAEEVKQLKNLVQHLQQLVITPQFGPYYGSFGGPPSIQNNTTKNN